jgi:hypothetical protein
MGADAPAFPKGRGGWSGQRDGGFAAGSPKKIGKFPNF